MGCNCGAKRKALFKSVRRADFRGVVAVAKSGIKEIVTGEDDGVLSTLNEGASDAE